MKIQFRSPTTGVTPSPEILEVEHCLEGAWETAVAAFQASNLSRVARGKKPSSGMQSYLTDAIDDGFESAGWVGEDGRYAKNKTWIRVSFRHSMSLGSDFLDAQRQLALEKYEHVAIVYAHQALLKRISPSDGGSLCSFERGALLIHDLEIISPGIHVWLGRLDI
jgi:hypothetical protein